LRHSLIHMVRTSTAEVDRRYERRFPGDLACQLSVAGRSSPARVADLSERGAHIRGGPWLPPGTRGTVTIDGVGFALPFNVRAAEGDGLHVAFELDEATAGKFRSMPERLAKRKAA
jgi:methyl-accepting chemotaxis protein